MPRSETILDVFIASPGDVSEERGILEDTVRDLNLEWSKKLNIRLEPIMWETSAYPDLGTDAQDVINKQINDYDIFIGIMWKHFGTPTGRAGSGTEEEFDIAYQKHLENPNQIKIMVYFKNAAYPINEIDADQLKSVFEFREKVKGKGALVWEYKEPEEFARKVRLHLIRQIQNWEEQVEENVEILPSYSTELESTLEEEGIIDLIEIGEENASKLEEVMNKITKIGEDFQHEIEELASTNNPMPSMAEIKKITNRMAKVMEKFASEIDQELPNFSESCSKTVDAFSRATIIYHDFNDGNKEEIINSLESVQGGKKEFNEALIGINGLRSQIASIPRISTNFNKAKKHTISTLDKFNDEIASSIDIMTEVEETLQKIIEEFENEL